MANTYTQLYVHIVFAVHGRLNLISSGWKEELYKYICGIIINKKQKPMAVNGMPDHIHLLVGLNPDCALSDLVQAIKANSSKWMNEKRFFANKFEWQKGFGAFTVGHSQLDQVASYIVHQEEHHKKKTFREEYISFLEAYQINYRLEYIFEESEDTLKPS